MSRPADAAGAGGWGDGYVRLTTSAGLVVPFTPGERPEPPPPAGPAPPPPAGPAPSPDTRNPAGSRAPPGHGLFLRPQRLACRQNEQTCRAGRGGEENGESA